MKKFLGNYNMLILVLVVAADIGLYLTHIISVIPYLVIAIGAFFLVTWGKIAHVKEINSYLEEKLDPEKFIKELEEYEKFNNFGKQKTNLSIAKMVAYADKGDWETINKLLKSAEGLNYSKDINLAFNMYVFKFSYYMNKKQYEDAEEQLAEMGELLDKLEKKDPNAFAVLTQQYDILDAEHDFYSAETKEKREENFAEFEIQENKRLNRENSKRSKIMSNYNLGKGYYIIEDYDTAKTYFQKVIETNGKMSIVEDSKEYIEKIEKQ